MFESNISGAIFIARIFAGILFFLQGYDKIFRVKVESEIQAIEMPFLNAHLPEWMVRVAAYLTSYIEFIGGGLLMLGLFKHYVLYALGVDLILVAAGFSILNPIWDMKHVFPRLLLVLFLLILPPEFDIFSLDHYLWGKF